MVNTNLRIGGLATGIDTDSIIRDLMRVERMPLDNKLIEKQLWQWKQEDYRSMNLSLYNLKNSAFNMKLQSPYMAKKVISGDTSIVTASATASASSGTYNIKVTQLASAASNASTASISLDPGDKIDTSASILSQAAKFANAGTFFDGKTDTDTFTVTVNGTDLNFTYGNSLDTIINTINENSDLNVSMFYDSGTDKIALSSTVTGASAQLEVGGDFLTSVLQIDNAQKTAGTDAAFELNGLATTRSTNTFTINNVTFSLKGLTVGGVGGTATTIEVQQDTDTVFNNIKSFVDSYNEVIESLYNKVKEERYRDYQPLTEEQKEAMSETEIKKWEAKARSGLLKNDSILNRIISEMRLTISATVEGVSGAKSLSEIGITTGSYWNDENGKLKIDETKLRAAIEADPEGVAELFNHSSETQSEKGLAIRLYDTASAGITRLTDYAGTSTKLYDQSYIGRRLVDLDKKIDSLEDRLVTVEARYWSKFTAMERAISSMNQQSSWLTSQLSSLQAQ